MGQREERMDSKPGEPEEEMEERREDRWVARWLHGKAFASKPVDLSSILRTHEVEEEILRWQYLSRIF